MVRGGRFVGGAVRTGGILGEGKVFKVVHVILTEWDVHVEFCGRGVEEIILCMSALCIGGWYNGGQQKWREESPCFRECGGGLEVFEICSGGAENSRFIIIIIHIIIVSHHSANNGC